jgi:hypothetical protein
MKSKLYYSIIGHVLGALLLFGMILPYMISSTQNELVVGGIVLLVAYIVFMGNIVRKYFNKLNDNENEKSV